MLLLPVTYSEAKASKSKRGFTLTELLTVIAIIVILLGILIPSILSIQRKANRAKTEALFGKIINAVTLYRTDNGAYPDLLGDLSNGDVVVNLNNSEQWARFTEILALSQPDGSAFENPKTRDLIRNFNPKYKRYFELQLSELETFGGAERLVDAFGNPHIYMVMDANLDGVIDRSALPNSPEKNLRQRIVIYTSDEGKDDFPEIQSWDY
ncbi:MAG: prepilin-type N-terminal cleavage/methylation domain-containing protein [Verrucomicrobia bacterium]|nr:prepilin-type N-terminal cleavage/methylation domain-containing protein [Verrucomicrobiota bacterium]MDA1067242.1 prepilin-type N-terminal cleavage/methylation domain-containing protein [Verrucomicrobiota bacterium]